MTFGQRLRPSPIASNCLSPLEHTFTDQNFSTRRIDLSQGYYNGNRATGGDPHSQGPALFPSKEDFTLTVFLHSPCPETGLHFSCQISQKSLLPQTSREYPAATETKQRSSLLSNYERICVSIFFCWSLCWLRSRSCLLGESFFVGHQTLSLNITYRIHRLRARGLYVPQQV